MNTANFGDRIKKYRDLNEMTQADLAKKLGVTRQAVSSWERGRTEPSMNDVEKMAIVFGVQKSDIIDNEKAIAQDAQMKRLIAYATLLKQSEAGEAVLENIIETMRNLKGI